MARSNRRWISQERGSFHIISRIAGGELLLKREEKDYFLELLKRFASGFFVQIHAFCIIKNLPVPVFQRIILLRVSRVS
jgi:REP element-mobilizing transposase RayT